MRIILILMFLVTSKSLWGHGSEKHSKMKSKAKKLKTNDSLQEKYNLINKEYIQNIKPIFKGSCFDCHSNSTNYPWYYRLPGVKQLIDSDIKDAKKHLNFSSDFPFNSHGTPSTDIDAIEKVIKNGSMPPFRYQVMHGESELSKEDISQIKEWIRSSKEILK